MTDLSSLSPLIEKIENAEEGDWWTDANIVACINNAKIRTDGFRDGGRFGIFAVDGFQKSIEVPCLTTSIDAIVGLIESELLPELTGLHIEIKAIYTEPRRYSLVEMNWPSHTIRGNGRTLALALCACFLKALQERKEG